MNGCRRNGRTKIDEHLPSGLEMLIDRFIFRFLDNPNRSRLRGAEARASVESAHGTCERNVANERGLRKTNERSAHNPRAESGGFEGGFHNSRACQSE